jgi:adenylyltransferase/sulfurtransferase
MNSDFSLSTAAWNDIEQHALAAFPEECCGVIFSDGVQERVQPLKNIQNQLHALDPQTYPRTAAIAYAIDLKELEGAIDQAERSGAKLKAFYHSHPDCDAYFSDEDKAFASPFGEPTFPGTAQIVVSVYDRAIRDIRGFSWSEHAADFVEMPIKRI